MIVEGEKEIKVKKHIGWPRGKYNGRRISGFSIKFKVDVTWWIWKPKVYVYSMKSIHWLCFHLWLEAVYDQTRIARIITKEDK